MSMDDLNMKWSEVIIDQFQVVMFDDWCLENVSCVLGLESGVVLIDSGLTQPDNDDTRSHVTWFNYCHHYISSLSYSVILCQCQEIFKTIDFQEDFELCGVFDLDNLVIMNHDFYFVSSYESLRLSWVSDLILLSSQCWAGWTKNLIKFIMRYQRSRDISGYQDDDGLGETGALTMVCGRILSMSGFINLWLTTNINYQCT